MCCQRLGPLAGSGGDVVNAFDWSRYAVGGAAARGDSFSRLNPDYAARVAQMIQAADAELGPRALTITSAYRSPELQAQLYDAAIKKYGSPEAARKWVAPPGRSKHNSGMAVDFANADGHMLRDANSREAQWIKANAARFGLAVPMSWEPWQVELAGSRGGAGPSPLPASAGYDYTPMASTQPGNALAAPQGQQPQRPEFQMADPRLDPRAFMTATNALAPMPLQRVTGNALGRV